MESARACFQLLSDRVQLSSEEIEEREIVSEVIGAAERGAGQDDFIELARVKEVVGERHPSMMVVVQITNTLGQDLSGDRSEHANRSDAVRVEA